MGKIKISTQLIVDEAQSRGWGAEFFDSSATSLVKITPPGEKSKLFKSTVTMLDSYVGGSVTNNKYETYLVLKDAGLPVPETALFNSTDSNRFIEAHSPVVIKPATTDHGDGITINIVTNEGTAEAYRYAQNYTSGPILIQEQLPGHDHRLLVVGEKVFVARRRKPVVVGDGVSTIQNLIESLNRDPRRGAEHSKPLSTISVEQVEQYLGARIGSIPQKGEVVEILGTSNLSSGGESVELSSVAHQSFRDYAVQAARLLGLRVCAVDMMCEDITRPAAAQRCGIIEMNVLAGIRMHHFPSEGEPVNVAAAILDEVFRREL